METSSIWLNNRFQIDLASLNLCMFETVSSVLTTIFHISSIKLLNASMHTAQFLQLAALFSFFCCWIHYKCSRHSSNKYRNKIQTLPPNRTFLKYTQFNQTVWKKVNEEERFCRKNYLTMKLEIEMHWFIT